MISFLAVLVFLAVGLGGGRLLRVHIDRWKAETRHRPPVYVTRKTLRRIADEDRQFNEPWGEG